MPVELRGHRGQLAFHGRRSSLRALYDQEPVADHEDVVRGRHRAARLHTRALTSRNLLYAGLDRLGPRHLDEVSRRGRHVPDRVELGLAEVEGATDEVLDVAGLTEREQHSATEDEAPGDHSASAHCPDLLMYPGVHGDIP